VVKRQLSRLAEGKKAKTNQSPLVSLIRDQMNTRGLTKRYKAWRAKAA
jgi:hypothetical protein